MSGELQATETTARNAANTVNKDLNMDFCFSGNKTAIELGKSDHKS